jgi:PadR family transcriptional regulator PadR
LPAAALTRQLSNGQALCEQPIRAAKAIGFRALCEAARTRTIEIPGWPVTNTLDFYLVCLNNRVMEPITGDALRGHLETMALAVLEPGAAHGFEILRRLDLAGNGTLKLKEGSLYPALYRLEEAGLIRSSWEEAQAGRRGPRRRVYSLTRKGLRQLDHGRAEWRRFVGVVGGILGVQT